MYRDITRLSRRYRHIGNRRTAALQEHIVRTAVFQHPEMQVIQIGAAYRHLHTVFLKYMLECRLSAFGRHKRKLYAVNQQFGHVAEAVYLFFHKIRNRCGKRP